MPSVKARVARCPTCGPTRLDEDDCCERCGELVADDPRPAPAASPPASSCSTPAPASPPAAMDVVFYLEDVGDWATDRIVAAGVGQRECGRCGGVHPRLAWRRLTRPVWLGAEQIVGWALCPALSEPCLLFEPVE